MLPAVFWSGLTLSHSFSLFLLRSLSLSLSLQVWLSCCALSFLVAEAAATFLVAPFDFMALFSAACSVNLGKAVVAGFFVSVCVCVCACSCVCIVVCVGLACPGSVVCGQRKCVCYNWHPPFPYLTPKQLLLFPCYLPLSLSPVFAVPSVLLPPGSACLNCLVLPSLARRRLLDKYGNI